MPDIDDYHPQPSAPPPDFGTPYEQLDHRQDIEQPGILGKFTLIRSYIYFFVYD